MSLEQKLDVIMTICYGCYDLSVIINEAVAKL